MGLVNMAAGLLAFGVAAKRSGEVMGALAEATKAATDSARRDLEALAEEARVTAGIINEMPTGPAGIKPEDLEDGFRKPRPKRPGSQGSA